MSQHTLIYEYVDLYFELSRDRKKYYPLTSIALNGHWEVDGVNYYRYRLIELLKLEPEHIAKTLDSIGTEDLDSFWFFYFDGPHLAKDMPDEVLALDRISKRVFASAKGVYEYYREVHIKD
ncbi:hypothetical protein [Vibrio mexicanus]|uniref:hypothetical protein n=1 Tax=Vibrio mexicanus TaxID=1004326 RepID=UPI00063CAF29|nr:hypothetical protein [Vibrio mexicanus]